MVWSGYTQRTVSWKDGSIVLVDQRKLPNRLSFIECTTHSQVVNAIKDMSVRGAPAIGAVAAMALALVAYRSKAKTKKDLIKELEVASGELRATRPTAVNLSWALQRIMNRAHLAEGSVKGIIESVKEEANLISEEDVKANRAIGMNGAHLLENGDVVLTHCK
jgi:methylthioribose-1-phosphate isomerase